MHRATGTPISEWQSRRSPLEHHAIAPDLALDDLDTRIESRTRVMFERGFVEEVQALLVDGVSEHAPGFDAIGYREVLAHLRGELDLTQTIEAVTQSTRRFARRQQAWFRRSDPTICWSTAVPLQHLE